MRETVTRNRNGKIDLLRFIFAIIIMLHHLGMRSALFDIMGIHFQVVNAGGYAVVFFFLTSGWLLMNTAEREIVSGSTDHDKSSVLTTRLLWKRYKFYMIWFLPAFVINMIWDCINCGFLEMVKHTFYNIPNLLMLQEVGFGNDQVYSKGYFVNASWYLSALMFCFLIVYPIVLWNKDVFLRIIAPLISIVGLYVSLHRNGQLRGGDWYPITVFSMGCLSYELSRYISNNVTSRKSTMVLKIVEFASYLGVVLYVCSNFPLDFEYPMTIVLMFAVGISFSSVSDCDVWNKPAFSFLGRASFPLYMLHEAIGLIYEKGISWLGMNYNSIVIRVILYVLCIIIAFVAQVYSDHYFHAKQ